MHRSVVDNWTADTTQELAACVTVCLLEEARCGGSRIPELAGQLFSEDWRLKYVLTLTLTGAMAEPWPAHTAHRVFEWITQHLDQVITRHRPTLIVTHSPSMSNSYILPPSEIIDKCSSNKKDSTNHPYAYQNISEDLSAAAALWLIYYNAQS